MYRELCVKQNCDYLFAVDSIAMLDSEDTLKHLIQIKRYNTVLCKIIMLILMLLQYTLCVCIQVLWASLLTVFHLFVKECCSTNDASSRKTFFKLLG